MNKHERNISYYQTLKLLHKCVRCQQQDARTLIGKPLCFECLEKKREENKKYDQTKAQAKSRQKCRDNNICVTCRTSPAKLGYRQCASCKEKLNKIYYDNLASEGRIPRSEAAAYGLCSKCLSAPRYKDKNTCIDCYTYIVNKFKGTRKKKTKWDTIIKADIAKREWYVDDIQKETPETRLPRGFIPI